MSKLKPGGLALVIDSVTPKNIGRCVHVISWHPPKADFVAPDGTLGAMPDYSGGWLCTGEVVCEGKMSVSGKDFRHEGWAMFPPEYLLPIDGDDFQHEDERQKELTYG